MAKNLKTSVRLDTKQAVRNLDNLEKKIRNVQRAINNQTTVTNKLTTATNKLVSTNNKATNASNKLTSSYNKQGKSVGSLTTKLHRLANAYLGVMGAKALITSSDTITKAENKLNKVNADQIQASGGNAYTDKGAYTNSVLTKTQSDMNKMYTSAQKVRMGYSDMISNVSKSMTLAGEAFGGNTDNAIRFQEIMAEAYTLGGASQAEQSSSMYQMIQGLGSGILQGDELRSVREGAPLAYAAIEEFAQGVYGAEKNLKDLASQGLITSDIVVAAIMSAGVEMDKSFANTYMTFEQAWTKIKNTALKSFEPVLKMLNKGLNSEVGQGIIAGIEKVIQYIAIATTIIFKIVGAVFTWIYDNWYWLKWIALSVLIIIGASIATLTTQMLYAAGVWLASALAPILPFALWVLAIGVIIAIIVMLAGSVKNAISFIVGVIMGALSVIWNAFVTWYTLMIQSILLPLFTAWDMFANFFGNLFNDPIASIIYAFEGLAQSVLGILQTIANGIDAIFGSNLASVVDGWKSKLGGKADELAAKYGNGTYEEKSNKAGELQNALNGFQTNLLWNTSDAFASGKDWGANAYDWAADKLGNAKDWVADKLNLTGITDEFINPTAVEDIVNGVNGVNDNTGTMADAMQLTTEDLEYLRKVADMEWKKEFTTATIQVDMSNYNTVNGDQDLDGIVTKLTDKLYEELNSVANGVYA